MGVGVCLLTDCWILVGCIVCVRSCARRRWLMIWSLRSRLVYYYTLFSPCSKPNALLLSHIMEYPHVSTIIRTRKRPPNIPRPISIHHRLQDPISASHSHKRPNEDPHPVQIIHDHFDRRRRTAPIPVVENPQPWRQDERNRRESQTPCQTEQVVEDRDRCCEEEGDDG